MPAWMSAHHEYPQLAIGPNGLPYLFFRKMIDRFPVEEHETLLKFGAETRRMQPWYDTIRGMSSIQVTGFDGATWLPTRELPLSVGGAYAQTGAVIAGGKLAIVWPADGRTYEDPHFRTSQLRYAEFELNETARADRMQAFHSEPSAKPDAAPTEQEDLARIQAVRWEDSEPLKLYRGDLHRHTDISADSTLDGDILLAYRYAYDAAALDFLAVTDHSGAQKFHYYQYQWWRNRQIATMFNQPGHFATFFGYERTVTFPGGHRNVISTRRDLQPVWISDEEFFGKESWAERLYPSLLKGGDIAIAHTVATGGGTDWRDGDPRAEPVVEIFQGLRGSYEEPNTPSKGVGMMRYTAGLVWNAWAKGRKLGVITSSDHSSTHQSYACVYAPELTAEAILSAIKERRTFGATDNIIVKLDAVTTAGNVYKMGRELTDVAAPKLRASIEGTQPLASVELIRNGKILLARNPNQRSDAFEFRDNDPLDTEAYYYLRIVQEDRQLAWSSPIWVTIE